MRRVLAVILDVDGTLYHALPLRVSITFFMALRLLTHPRAATREIRILSAFRRAQESLRRHACAITPESQYELAAAAIGAETGEIKECVSRWMEQLPLRLIPLFARKSLIRDIRAWDAAGLPIGVYSDYPAAKKLEALGLGAIVKVIVCSTDADVRSFKPGARGFLVACGKLGHEARNVLYIGDRAIDLEGSRNAGMMGRIIRRAPPAPPLCAFGAPQI